MVAQRTLNAELIVQVKRYLPDAIRADWGGVVDKAHIFGRYPAIADPVFLSTWISICVNEKGTVPAKFGDAVRQAMEPVDFFQKRKVFILLTLTGFVVSCTPFPFRAEIDARAHPEKEYGADCKRGRHGFLHAEAFGTITHPITYQSLSVYLT